MWDISEKLKILHNFCLTSWRANILSQMRVRKKTYVRDVVRGVLTVCIRLKLLIPRGHHCTSQSDAVSPYFTEIHRESYLNLHSEYPAVRNSGACYCSPVILITAITVLFTCGEALTYSQDRPSDLSYQFSDAIDRKSFGKYPQSKLHALASVLRV
jgi:hypothetical protein